MHFRSSVFVAIILLTACSSSKSLGPLAAGGGAAGNSGSVGAGGVTTQDAGSEPVADAPFVTGGNAGGVGGSTSPGGTAGTDASAGGTDGTGAIYVAPSGLDSNPGSMDEPLLSLAAAVQKASAGTTIYLRAGTYKNTATITLAKSGTEAAPIRVWAYPNERPVFDFSTQPYGSTQRGIMLTGNYWHIKGLEIAYAGDNGMKLEGSHNRIEACVFHHNGDSGLQLGFAHETANPNGELCAYNEIINCDSYLNFDFDNMGSDADGFSCKMHPGKGNVFRGCRSWHNGDDGWDLYETDHPVQILNCWTWHNGDQTDFDAIYLAKMGKKMSSYQGNGNGFKLGGNGTGGNSKGTHVVKNCVAFDNNFRSKKGFDQNSHKGGVLVQNCTAWGNGYNYMFEDAPDSGMTNEFDNNIEFGHAGGMAFEFATVAILKNNSWQLPVTADSQDFASLAETLALAPRQADGSLPVNDFARLVEGSDLIDKGVDVGLPFTGAAPDLGAFER